MEKKFEYKVIGWTKCTDKRFQSYNQSREAYEALIKDIRENGYKFGGDAHEEYTPVFNDGTAARFSWRGWGGVMADAWQPNNPDPYKYSLYYMNENLKPSAIKYPKTGVDFEKIERPTHDFPVYDRKFTDDGYICEKTLFIELTTDELKKIKRGDFINFTDGESGEPLIDSAYVVKVYSADTVEEMVKQMARAVPEWKDFSEELGLGRELSKSQILEALNKKLPPEEVQKRGLFGMEIFYP